MLKHELLALIEQKRAELIQTAIANGLSSSVGILYSQELDYLLNEYHRNYINKVPATS